jgi:hypothetical protein
MSWEAENSSLEIAVWRVIVEISMDEGEDTVWVFVEGGGYGGEDYLVAGLVG